MPSHPSRRPWRRLLPLLLPIWLAACGFAGREPPHDPAIAGAVTALTLDTQRLLNALSGPAPGPFSERAALYRDLIARSGAIRLMAEARGAGALAGPTLVGRLLAGRGQAAETAGKLTPDLADRLGDYADATGGFMADYRRNLDGLAAMDAEAHAGREARLAAHAEAMAAHETALRAYLAGWEAWRRGEGPEPVRPADPPVLPAAGIPPARLALRRTALEDILRDALIYERTILDRSR